MVLVELRVRLHSFNIFEHDYCNHLTSFQQYTLANYARMKQHSHVSTHHAHYSKSDEVDVGNLPTYSALTAVLSALTRDIYQTLQITSGRRSGRCDNSVGCTQIRARA